VFGSPGIASGTQAMAVALRFGVSGTGTPANTMTRPRPDPCGARLPEPESTDQKTGVGLADARSVDSG
jgi:hypothetical protein